MADQTQLQPLKGFRDFLPQEKRARDFVIGKVREVFERFGFDPLETPTLEYASLLLGKYGAEADKLVYTFEDNGGRNVGLRYDQTVPTARVLSEYQNELPKYFRRYQIQNVFRADKPQKGRYREFAQCDIDIFGSTSPLADAEIVACTYAAFQNVGFANAKIKINDRQTLFMALEQITSSRVSALSIIQSIDKLDKITPEQVVQELCAKGMEKATAEKALSAVQNAMMSENLAEIIEIAESLGVPSSAIEYSPSLARGLDYYTGMILEVVLPEYPIGSFGGGGRYDKLIGMLSGSEGTPAVGIAFGLDRMVEAAKELKLVPSTPSAAKILVTVFDSSFIGESARTAAKLREQNIATELYPTATDKLDKQLKYANKKGIPFVVVIGSDEKAAGNVVLKNMTTGEQQKVGIEMLPSLITT